MSAVREVMVTCATWLMLARASPRNPYVLMLLRSSKDCSLLVVKRSHTISKSSRLVCSNVPTSKQMQQTAVAGNRGSGRVSDRGQCLAAQNGVRRVCHQPKSSQQHAARSFFFLRGGGEKDFNNKYKCLLKKIILQQSLYHHLGSGAVLDLHLSS